VNSPAPATRLAAFRVLTGTFAVVYLVVRLPHLLDAAHFDPVRFRPVGPLRPLDTAPSPGVATAAVVLGIVLGVAYTVGWRFRATGPAFAVLLLFVLSLRNSWGQIFHVDNLLLLHVLIVGLSPAAAAWSLDARRRPPPTAPDVRFGFPLRLAAVVTVCTYVVTGWAKLRYAGLDWLSGDTLLHQIAFDNARKKVLGDEFSPFAAPALGHPWLFRPMGPITLLVELAAPVALLGRRAAAVWSSVAWVFHVGILALMWIAFPYPLTGIAFAPFFRLERAVPRLGAWVRSRTPESWSLRPRPSPS
jgi:HTTM domain